MNLLKSKLTLFLPFIIIAPFLIIACFNNPALDDWWYAIVYKQYGILGAQHYWYTHYTARFFSNLIMTMAPLSWGFTVAYKFTPMLFIAMLFGTCLYVSKVFFSNYPAKPITLALWFTAAYLLIQRDYFEAFYWLSANVVYQYTLLYTLIHTTLLFQLYYLKQITVSKKIISIALAVAIVGSNETLGGLILLEAILLVIFSVKQKIHKGFSLMLLGVVVLSWMIMFAARGNWDKISIATTEHIYTFNLFLAIKHSAISVGYYSAFLVKQIFFWAIIALALPVVTYFYSHNFKILSVNSFLIGSGVCFGIAFTIYFISIYPTGILIPPLRVTNIAMFFLSLGIIQGLNSIVCKVTMLATLHQAVLKYSMFIMFAIIVFASIAPTKFRQVLLDITSGRASSYNNQMKSRYKAILSHSTNDTLHLLKLKNVPRSIVATDISGPVSHNIASVFDKTFKVVIE